MQYASVLTCRMAVRIRLSKVRWSLSALTRALMRVARWSSSCTLSATVGAMPNSYEGL
jgi:hypothetical protein